jgi:hypothetical protein
MGLANAHKGLGWGASLAKKGISLKTGRIAKRMNTNARRVIRSQLFILQKHKMMPPPSPTSTLSQTLGNSKNSVNVSMRLPPSLSWAMAIEHIKRMAMIAVNTAVEKPLLLLRFVTIMVNILLFCLYMNYIQFAFISIK